MEMIAVSGSMPSHAEKDTVRHTTSRLTCRAAGDTLLFVLFQGSRCAEGKLRAHSQPTLAAPYFDLCTVPLLSGNHRGRGRGTVQKHGGKRAAVVDCRVCAHYARLRRGSTRR